jgi:hypothetical protein
VIRSDAGFERREHEDLFIGADFENATATVPDVEIAVVIEDNAGRDTHAFSKQLRSSGTIDPVDVPFISARDEQFAGKAEGQPGGIHDVRYKRRDRTLWRNLVDRHRSLLSTTSTVGCIDVPAGVDCGIRDRMEIRSELLSDFIRKRTAGIAIRRDDQFGSAQFC